MTPRAWLGRRGAKRLAAGALLLFAASFAKSMGNHPPPAARFAASGTPEAQLVRTLHQVGARQLDVALRDIDQLIAARPDFRLAHLVKGDLLAARARPLKTLGDAPNADPERIADLREEAMVRVARSRMPRPENLAPRYLLDLLPEQKHAIVIDASRSTLFLFEHKEGKLRYVADYYVTSGRNGLEKLREGDKKTPLGVYHITGTMPREKLTDFYGPGAWPINYPNEWDRREGRKGYGIWLHGTPSDTYSRPPRASDGCIVLTNGDLASLAPLLEAGSTPVVIAGSIEWAKADELARTRAALRAAVEQWRRDWESVDASRYLAHYAESFSAGKVDLERWSAQKRGAIAGRQWIKVKVENFNAFLYPGRDDLALVSFEQEYASDTHQAKARKRQFWQRTGGAWKIVFEGAAG